MTHKGICVGGPLAGLTIETRSQLGFVAVDRPGFAAWLYYADEAGRYVLDTTQDDSSIDDDGTRALDLERALSAGVEKGLDVIALPGTGDDEADDDDELPADLFAGVEEGVSGDDSDL